MFINAYRDASKGDFDCMTLSCEFLMTRENIEDIVPIGDIYSLLIKNLKDSDHAKAMAYLVQMKK